MSSLKDKKIERWFKSYTRNKILKELEIWSGEYAQKLGGNQSAIKKDMRKRYIKVAITPYEYYAFKLFNKNEQQKEEFLSKAEQHEIFFKGRCNTFPRSKFERYKIFKELFKRDILGITFKDQDEERLYQAFIKKHPVFVVKPSEGTEGRGVFRATAEEIPDLKSLQALVKEECLVEQLINQGEELAVFHPESINTVRVVTSLDEKGVFQVIHALVRNGIGGSFVDNAGAGGIFALINTDQGIICSDGYIGLKKYAAHPDSGVVYKGFAIPKWKELICLAERGHRLRPGQVLIGWDFAWTEDGYYDVVEVNPNPLLDDYQILYEKGIKPRFYMIKEWP